MGLSPIDSFTLIQPEPVVAIYEIGFLGVMNIMYGHRICKMYKILAVMDWIVPRPQNPSTFDPALPI